MKSLSFYEFAGIVLPGIIVILGISILFPNMKNFLFNNTLSVGDFGLVLILAYAAGQINQAVGNLVESVWWQLQGGTPTDWVRQRKGDLLTDTQLENSLKLIYSKLDLKIDVTKISASEWRNVTCQIYVSLIAQNRTERIDIFNGNYGMNRGIAAVLITLALLTFFSEVGSIKIALLLLGLSFIAISRMSRFAKYYARELFLQFLVNK